MLIKSIEVRNFRSFKRLYTQLGRLNILVGANASGKSNFVEFFKFIRDISTFGLRNAVSLQGGAQYLRNISLGASEECTVRIVADLGFTFMHEDVSLSSCELIYEFSLAFPRTGSNFRISKDELTISFDCNKVESQTGKPEARLGCGKVIVSVVEGRISHRVDLDEGIPLDENSIPLLPVMTAFTARDMPELPPKVLFLETPFSPFSFTGRDFDSIAIYNFDPKLPQRAVPITGKTELEGDGSNLAIVLKSILENKSARVRLTRLLRDILPFVVDLRVKKFADRSLFFELQETYTSDRYLPASFLSEGTINLTALIVALYFERKPVVIFEEPERNVHPFLASRIVAMLRDASRTKQIIATTHNPELVRSMELADLLLISRDQEGFSTISRPAESDVVKAFLKEDMGIADLYVQDLLGV
jgi:predicted ATPase